MNNAIICYLTYSGNTEEVAKIIKEELEKENYKVDMYEVGFGVIPNLSQYNLIFIGTFTWDIGATPDEIKDFVADLGYKPDNIYIFGTGDTQFGGDDLFCRAADRLAKFYNSKYKPLKIEQSPRGKQERKVIKWTKEVLQIHKEENK